MVLSAEKGHLDILNLLFINHRRFPDFKTVSGKQRLCFIEIENYDHKIQEACLDAKNEIFSQSHAFSSLSSSLSKAFDLKQFLQHDNLDEILKQKEKISEEKRVELIPFFEQTTKNSVLALLAEPLIENWQMQSPLLRTEKILNGLKKIKGIKPWLHLGICPHCPDFQLVIGELKVRLNKCPKLRHKQCEITVYMFDEEYSKWKIDDNDLPYFISEYITNKTSRILKPKVNKKLKSVEIDCYLLPTKLGIECKQFVRDFNLSQDTTKLISDTVDQLTRYNKAGIKRAILVSNVDVSKFGKFRKDIENGINKNSITFDYFKIINDPPSLIKELEKEIALVAKLQKK